MNTARVDKAYMELVREFPLIPLRDKSEYDEAIKVMKRLAYRRSSLSNGEADYLTVLGDLIAQYEKRLPRLAEHMTPQEALTFLMESNGLAQADLVEYVGYKSNLSAFLSGHRGLSKRAACRLAEYFKVSPALFMPKE
ncbi:MAG: transcriptional regulator [Candidatus Melainabacteria bacterium]|nr:transcriptional regulator [Candidatus Melainabacteria bacterium]